MKASISVAISVLFALLAAAAAGGTVTPANNSTLLSDHGDMVAARQASETVLFGESPSWRGTGMVRENPPTAPDPTTDVMPKTGPGRETIIGADRRVRINPTTSYPARATTFIVFNQGSGTFSCSGWLISKDTVATAGHCVNTGPAGGSAWSTNVTVYPGRNGSSSPYGTCGASRLWSVSGWVNNGNENYDYGAIKLNCTIGVTTGWYGYFWQSDTLTGYPASTRGYPGDKNFGTQWLSDNCAGASGFTQCKIAVTQTHQLFYSNDTFDGQSGSPIYYDRSSTCNPCGMAIHAYGLHGSYPHNTYNHGERITQSVYNFLLNIVNM
jgi:glutamyl endopeptidase